MIHASTPLIHVLMALAAVIALGWLLGKAFRVLGQPPVIGEVVAGLALGPSLLGRISPEAMDFLLPPSSAPYLGVIAQLGVVLYMFQIGLELNPAALQGRIKTTVVIAVGSIAAPFALGALLAFFLHPHLSSSDVPAPILSFTLFLGVAMAITAFPVLARILSDLGLQATPLGVFALGCAAVGDATAWCLLAMVVGVANAQVNSALIIVGLAIAYVAGMFLLVRPAAAWLLTRGAHGRGTTALLFVGLLLSAWTTEAIGIHAIFGAFLMGVVVPHDSTAARELSHKLEGVITVLLLPAFFAFTGLRTEIGLVSGLEAWLGCGLIVLVATVGKVGGATFSARATGMGWGDSAALGVLMNTRGLMELIVLNIGLDLKILPPQLFAMMVVMALVTTMATAPLLRLMGVTARANA